MRGIARKNLIVLREERNNQTPGESELTKCPYHRTEGGCVLGEFKSPYCIGHIDCASELDEKFEISGYGLMDAIHEHLAKILSAKSHAEIAGNVELVEKFKQEIRNITARVETFPMLKPVPANVSSGE